MASFDVQSLFTNVPLKETLEIVLNSLFRNSTTIHCLDKQNFKELLNISTKGIIFLFNGIYYKEVDDVAMGSPLDSTLGNTFMCFY